MICCIWCTWYQDIYPPDKYPPDKYPGHIPPDNYLLCEITPGHIPTTQKKSYDRFRARARARARVFFWVVGICPGVFSAWGVIVWGYMSGVICLGGICLGGICPRTGARTSLRAAIPSSTLSWLNRFWALSPFSVLNSLSISCLNNGCIWHISNFEWPMDSVCSEH